MSDKSTQETRNFVAIISGALDFQTVANLGAANQGILKTDSGIVRKIYCQNLNASARYFQIHDKKTAPANTDVPLRSYLVAANSTLRLEFPFFGINGLLTNTGLSWAFSSTAATLTLATASDQIGEVGFD